MKRILITLVLSILSIQAKSQDLALSANLAEYINLGTINLGAEYGIARHWSLNATVKYNPFDFGPDDKRISDKERSVSLGTRFWPWHIYSGWWISASAKYQEYNTTKRPSPLTREGDRFGASAGAGYTYMLSSHFNLDIGASFWAGYQTHTTYACPRCGNVLDRGSGAFFLPSEIVLALTYIF